MTFIKLKALCKFEKGTTGLAKAEPGNYPLVTTSAERKSCNTYQFDTRAVCIPLVSSTGHGHASLRNVHYQEGKFALGSILVALTSKNDNRLDIQFLHLYLSQLKDQVLVPLMSGAANVALSIKKIQDIEIPLPSIERQREIVERFKSVIIEEDELKSELAHQQTLLKKLRQQILQEAIEGKFTADWRTQNPDVEPASELLKRIAAEKEQLIKDKKIKAQKPQPPITDKEKLFELPQGWEWCRLGSLLESAANGIYKPAHFYCDDGVASLRMYNIQDGEIMFDKVRHLELNDSELNQYQLQKNDLLLNRVNSRELVGKTAIVRNDGEPMVFESMNMRLRFSLNSVAEFVNQYLLTPYSRLYFFNVCKIASGQVSVNQGQVSGLCVAVPPTEEQKAIIAKITILHKICSQLETQITQNQAHTEQLMQTVLKEAFSHNRKIEPISITPQASTHLPDAMV